METYGYARVSSKDQNEGRQLTVFYEMNVSEKNIYVDKQSGKDFDRPMYKKLMRKIKRDDLIYIKSIDRLGRNYEEILEQWKFITKDKEADIVVLDMPILDTRRGKDLMGTFLADIVLALLSYVAETERCNIKQRQAEGIAVAKAQGVKFGRKRKPLSKKFYQAYQLWKNGVVTVAEAAEYCGMAKSTFYDKAKKYQASQEISHFVNESAEVNEKICSC